MNSKTTRKYELTAALVGMANMDDMPGLVFTANISELAGIDFTTAFDMWEYALTKKQDGLIDPALCDILQTKPFAMFMSASEQKTRTMFMESLPIQKFVYGSCANATAAHNIAFLTNFILTNKLDTAGECLTRLRLNPGVDFSDAMRAVVDDVFATYCSRNNVRVPVLNKKQKTLLLENISKTKNPNKALLTQRLKEL